MSPLETLQRLQSVVEEEFKDDFSLVFIKWYEVFLVCADFIENIGKSVHKKAAELIEAAGTDPDAGLYNTLDYGKVM